MPTKIVFTSHIPEVLKGLEDTAQKRMAESVQTVRNETLVVLSGNRSGRQYKVPGTSRFYTASSPGQPPAQRLGELRQSIQGTSGMAGGNIIGIIGTELNYGLYLQAGTKNIAPRPWLDVAFRNAWDKVISIWSRSWEK